MRNHRVSKDRNEDVERTWKTHRIRGSRWRGQDDSIAGAVCRSTNSRCENIVAVVSRKGDRHAGESHLPDTSSAGIVLSKHLERGQPSTPAHRSPHRHNRARHSACTPGWNMGD